MSNEILDLIIPIVCVNVVCCFCMRLQKYNTIKTVAYWNENKS